MMEPSISLPNVLKCHAKDIGCTFMAAFSDFEPHRDYYTLTRHESECPLFKLYPLLKAQSSRISELEKKVEKLLSTERSLPVEPTIDEDFIAGRYIMMDMTIHGVESTCILEIDPDLASGRFRYDRLRSPQPLENFRVINGILLFNMVAFPDRTSPPPTKYSGEFSASTKGLVTGSWICGWQKGRWMALKI